jgi:hypothetical protein
MKQKNRETMERAIGFVEGLSCVGDEKVSNALVALLEMLEEILKDEESEE